MSQRGATIVAVLDEIEAGVIAGRRPAPSAAAALLDRFGAIERRSSEG